MNAGTSADVVPPRTSPALLRLAATVLLLLPLLALSPRAQAVGVQSLINDLCQYYVLDSDTCSAKAVIECLVKSGGNMSGMQQCAADYDPKAQKFIDIYGAATKPDYVRLIELAGPVIACKLLPPGPPTDILCSTALKPIITKAFGKAAKIYDAASKGDWLTVIYVVGDPTIACEVVPAFPGKDITCGAVAQVLVAGGKLLKQGAEAGIAALESGVQALGDLASSGLKSLGLGGAGVAPENIYYQNAARPLLHQRALRALVTTGKPPFLGFDGEMHKQCVAYVKSGLLNSPPSDWNIKTCQHKSQQLHDEATALANLVRVAPGAYFENIHATASLLLATNFWSGKAEQFVTAIRQLPRPKWSEEGFQSLPSPFSAVLGNCYATTRAAFPVPVGPKSKDFLAGALYPPNLWGWVCGSAGIHLSFALASEKERITKQVIPLLAGAGCVLAKTGDHSLKFDCNNGKALALCHALLPQANPNSRCRRSASFQAPTVQRVQMTFQPAATATPPVVAPPKRLAMAVAAGALARPVTIEAEALVRSNAVRVSGGRADAQPMAGFGAGWSAGEQLFWSGGAPGSTLELTFEVPAAGRYSIEMHLTRAPDYGRLGFEIDGEPGGDGFDGFDPAVVPVGPVPLGVFTLATGAHRIRITITGRNRQANGYFAGIDSLRLVPATATE
ncbi:MAG: hypothetical protein EPO25_05415 [Gammaproteobacteria bacterium]|nr:MAG: hypothetical protein EPO25_05415 [Gammaproteobacteria bacterium]